VKHVLVFLIVFVFSSCTEKKEQRVRDVDFETSLGKGSREWDALVQVQGNQTRLVLLQQVYGKRKPSILPAKSTSSIPKCIHQIWLGPKSLPSYFKRYQRSWMERHPDWEYRLWTDKDIDNFDFEMKDLYNRSTNFGEKSDILRAEILDRFGGLYVDVDVENIQSFDELHEKYDFFAGLEPPHEGNFTSVSPHLVISDALIGAAKGHPIIKEWKQKIRTRWDEYEMNHPDSPKRVLFRTFYTFGEATSELLDDDRYCNIVFPPTYFYPLTFSQVDKGRAKKKCCIKKEIPFTSFCF
jgi:glycosyl transferase-like sugar-binding protein